MKSHGYFSFKKSSEKLYKINIIQNEPMTQLNSTIDSAASLLKGQLNEMKGIKYTGTLKLTFKKTTIDANKKDTITTF